VEDKENAIVFFMREKGSDQDIESAISEVKIPFVSTSEKEALRKNSSIIGKIQLEIR
jgi:hypothetical protein